MPAIPVSPWYLTLSTLGIFVTLVLWWRCGKPPRGFLFIYLAGIGGWHLGAKIAYLFSEGWLRTDDPPRWMYWISGKSIMGAPPGGGIGVELAKSAPTIPASRTSQCLSYAY